MINLIDLFSSHLESAAECCDVWRHIDISHDIVDSWKEPDMIEYENASYNM